MNFLRAAASVALFLLWLAGPAGAEDVTLTSRDGSIELTGDLLGYDGEYYRIATEYGVLTVDGSGVICDGPGCPSLGSYVAQLTFSGAPEVSSVLIPALIEGFALRRGYAVGRADGADGGLVYTLYEGEAGGQKAAEFTILRNSSDEGFADLLGENADFALTLREVTGNEARLARDAGLGDLKSVRQTRVLALDALVPVVAPGNPVRKLTIENLVAIYSGKVTNWSELGGEDAPITAYLAEDDVGFTGLFLAKLMRGQGVAQSVLRKPSNHAVTHAVVNDPFGIGIATFSDPGGAEIVTLTGSCGFEVAPGVEAIKAEDYPLTAPLYLYLPARRLPKIGREFLTYLRSSAAQMVVRRTGLVDQMPGETTVDDQGRRLANAIAMAGDEVTLEQLKTLAELMVGDTRLSVTFRFRDGSSALDGQSLSNVALLANLLEAGRFDGRVVRFVGFTDGNGRASVNLRLAEKRARAVRQAVLDAAEALDPARVEMQVAAFGEALPMACDDTGWGRQVNRRVEVWLH